jgi:hypothetical protein
MHTGPTRELHGRCHCGRSRLVFSTAIAASALIPRACDCAFCRKHGAAYLSDPAGRLQVRSDPGAGLHAYRQGANNARFLLCDDCGVLLAVVYDAGERVYGAVNARCLDEEETLPDAVAVSPQSLSPDERIARWIGLWIPDVDLGHA